MWKILLVVRMCLYVKVCAMMHVVVKGEPAATGLLLPQGGLRAQVRLAGFWKVVPSC